MRFRTSERRPAARPKASLAEKIGWIISVIPVLAKVYYFSLIFIKVYDNFPNHQKCTIKVGNYGVPGCTILYYTTLHYTILYYTVLYTRLD